MIKPSLDQILVTGLPRSGTSFVTEILHCDLGYDMALTMNAPMPGKSFLEYEDAEFGQFLMKCWMTGHPPSKVEKWAKMYFDKREERSRSKIGYGVKSPFILLYPFEVIDFKRSIVIKTRRSPLLSLKSINNLGLNHAQFDIMTRLFRACEETWRYVKADIVVDFEEKDFNRGDIREFLTLEILRVKQSRTN